MFNLWCGLWPIQVDLIYYLLKLEFLSVAKGHTAKLYNPYGESMILLLRCHCWYLVAKIAEHRACSNIKTLHCSWENSVNHWLYKCAICFYYIDLEMSYIPKGAQNIWIIAHWSKFLLCNFSFEISVYRCFNQTFIFCMIFLKYLCKSHTIIT